MLSTRRLQLIGVRCACSMKGPSKSDNVIKLVNKAPKWNPALGAYCLNFNGRVTQVQHPMLR
jgi:Tub family